MSRILAAVVAALILLSASSAWAIQGYKDRHGFFVGGGIGGGPGSVILDDGDVASGLEGTGDLGLHLNLIAGGGMTDNIVFGAEVNSWIRTVAINQNQLNHQQWSFNAVGDFFLVHGLFLEGGLGLAYAYSDGQRADGTSHRYQEMGLAAKLGLGFEYFLNGTVAAGIRFGYTRHFYSRVDFDTFTGSVMLRWY